MQDPGFSRLIRKNCGEYVPNRKKNEEKEDKIFKIGKDQWGLPSIQTKLFEKICLSIISACRGLKNRL